MCAPRRRARLHSTSAPLVSRGPALRSRRRWGPPSWSMRQTRHRTARAPCRAPSPLRVVRRTAPTPPRLSTQDNANRANAQRRSHVKAARLAAPSLGVPLGSLRWRCCCGRLRRGLVCRKRCVQRRRGLQHRVRDGARAAAAARRGHARRRRWAWHARRRGQPAAARHDTQGAAAALEFHTCPSPQLLRRHGSACGLLPVAFPVPLRMQPLQRVFLW
mmetsp:Transcript_14858/g.43651  ORF Transcript_14858/g.43651 Transcript_14858/m.43651 type:complete len:217 (-) Transcript_14858:607-1257(-)